MKSRCMYKSHDDGCSDNYMDARTDRCMRTIQIKFFRADRQMHADDTDNNSCADGQIHVDDINIYVQLYK